MHRIRVWADCRLSQHLNDLRAPLARLNSSGIFDKPLTKCRLGIWNPREQELRSVLALDPNSLAR